MYRWVTSDIDERAVDTDYSNERRQVGSSVVDVGPPGGMHQTENRVGTNQVVEPLLFANIELLFFEWEREFTRKSL